jgi:hypothetical protein
MLTIRNILLFLLLTGSVCFAQSDKKNSNDVYVDSDGVMRWNNSNKEVSLFGVNYTTPFAYSYRAHKKMGLDLRKAIDLDVAQMKRLGFDAFRVHVWEKEISDKDGNVIKNEHLDLFDYLLAKLSENGIKIIVTPIAWWGAGWPEPDEKTNGFSSPYSKLEMITNPTAKAAQRNYLKQFIEHVNPYKKVSYKNDPSIIAVEIINEPNHPAEGNETTEYIKEMVNVIRAAGYTKPIFYNISENWNDVQAQAVCNADIQGISFQWYPTDLVHNKTLHGNYLINVNKYLIPSSGVAGYNKKAKMVYEFDAADIGASYMYPAMARSFRQAGMQFATMFSYDPSQIAWSNTEYPTHFLNLLYTPTKAIGLMIAAKAFHELPLMKSCGEYPQNNNFGNFRVSYKENLSEMNSDSAFYYSNNTETIPRSVNAIKHIAGVGNSALVEYDGTGAYFLDKHEDGVWRLEVYPDVLWLCDPFEQTSMKRHVARLFWNERKVSIKLHDLGKDFSVSSLQDVNYKVDVVGSSIRIKPGIYLITSKQIKKEIVNKYLPKHENFLDGLYTSQADPQEIFVVNKTNQYSSESKQMDFKFEIASEKQIKSTNLFLRRFGWRRFEKHSLKNIGGFEYGLTDSLKFLNAGNLEYCISVELEGQTKTFPYGVESNPEDWDFNSEKLWTVKILSPNDPFVLLNVSRDRKDFVFPQYSRSMRYMLDYKNGSNSESTSLSVGVTFTEENKIPFGIQLNIPDLLKQLGSQIDNYENVFIKARSTQNTSATIALKLITIDGKVYSSSIKLKDDWQNIQIPWKEFNSGDALILPFSYPKFLSKTWTPSNNSQSGSLKPSEINSLQIVTDQSGAKKNNDKWEIGFEIESIYLK